jgi:TIR domain
MQRLADALQQQGKSVWAERTEPPAAAEWQQESQRSIDAAQNILVVLSPEFVNSLYNQQELNYAISLNKRLIPIVYRERFNPAALNPKITKLNWLYFREFDDFDRALSELLEILL